jgi:hypothetical protein
VPVAELDRERKRGQGRDAAQTAEPGDDRGEALVAGRLGDRPVERITTRLRLSDRAAAFVEGHHERRRGEAQAAQPALVRERPGRAGPDEAAAQQQLRKPMPGAHRIRARVLARPNKITRSLLELIRDAHRRQLTQAQQTNQPLRVTAIALDPLARRPRDLARRRHDAGDPGARARARELVPGRTRLIANPDRPRQRSKPLHQQLARGRHTLDPQLPALSIEHTRNGRTSVQVDPDPRTFSHTGASRKCGSTAGPLPTATRANVRTRRRALHTV